MLDRQVLTAVAPLDTIPAEANNAFALMAEAWHTIDDRYVDQTAVSDTALAYGAISGMVNALGDTGHSRFLSPEMVTEQHNFTQGQFEGIGAYVEMRDGYPVIVAPIDNSPAQAAGLQPGDVITAVNGEDVRGLPLYEIVQRILGPAGTDVTLNVVDPTTGETREMTLKRAKVVLNNVTWQRLPGTTIAHLRITSFSQGVSQDLQQALMEIEGQGLTGIVLDLRNNPGGLLNEAIGVASQFLGADKIVLLRQDAEGKVAQEKTQLSGKPTSLPVVVLINQGSASASEIVAGALQDNGRAILLGEKTFGTGTVLNEFGLSDGSALLLATEEWLTPNGRLIWHQGIIPDKEVTLSLNSRLLFPEAERTLTAEQLQTTEDTQLLQAINLLQEI